MGTTPPGLTPAEDPGVVPAMPAPTDPVDLGDSESAWLALAEVGVVTGVCASEFLREDFFEERVAVEPVGAELPLPRLRFLITSVFRLSGLTTPCNFRNKPQALQRGWPSGLRRHNGVVCVKQFVQVVGALPSP